MTWDPERVEQLLSGPLPSSTVELWNASGIVDEATRLAVLRNNSRAFAESAGAIWQRSILGAGTGPGFRPEQWAELENVTAVDAIALASELAGQFGLDLGAWAQDVAVEVFSEVVDLVAADLVDSVVSAVPVVGPVVRFLVAWGRGIAAMIRADIEQNERDESSRDEDSCPLPGYSASIDQVLAESALSLLSTGDWSEIFRPLSLDTAPWNVCPPVPNSPVRSITPRGLGLGTWQDDVDPGPFGLSCTPMIPGLLVHRGWIANTTDDIREIGDGLPLLASVGARAWSLLWGRGPAAFAVDGDQLADQWRRFLDAEFAASRPANRGTWKQGNADWWLKVASSRLRGSSQVQGSSVGIGASFPVAKAWEAFAVYQRSLLGRPVVAYVDARSCHPAWRKRIEDEQRDLLTSPRVCDLDLDRIRDPAYLDAVTAERVRRGAVCFAAHELKAPGGPVISTGPSLDPLGGPLPPIPEPPIVRPPRAPTPAPSNEGGGGGLLAAAGLGVGLGALAWSRRKRR